MRKTIKKDMKYQVAQADAYPPGDFGGIVNLALGGCAPLSWVVGRAKI
jgi:hypothetical protein